MAIVTNTVTTHDIKGIREDLSDIIYNISPTDTPFMSNAARGSDDNTLFEWQTDALAAADNTNAQLEADDVATYDAITPTVRLGNYMQISRKTAVIGGTTEAVKKAGRKSEKSYQLAKKGKELKLDMEKILVGTNQGASAGSDTTKRYTGSVLAFITSNVNKAADGVNPVYTTLPSATRTDGTTRPFTESLLMDVLEQGYTAGADFDMLMVGAKNKQVASRFNGIATKTYQMTSAKKAAIIGAADVYVSDFGVLTVVPNRLMRATDAFLFDFEYIEVTYLRPFKTVDLAKTGDAEKTMLIVEYGLKVKTEKALGLVADLS